MRGSDTSVKSRVVLSHLKSLFFLFLFLFCVSSQSLFSPFFFIYLIFLQSLLSLLKCIREVDPRIYVCGPRNLNFIVYYCRKRLKLTPQKQLTRQLFYTEKHISNFNLFNLQILPVMKTEKLKLDQLLQAEDGIFNASLGLLCNITVTWLNELDKY